MTLWNWLSERIARSPARRRGRQRGPERRRRAPPLAVEPLEDRCVPSGDAVLRWNEIAMQAAANAPSSRIPLARNLAIIQVAVFDAVDAIDRSYTPYAAAVPASRGASLDAAVAQAAHDTLAALYPAQQATFDAALAADLADIPPGLAGQGIEIGHAAAQQILDLRASDGAGAVVVYAPAPAPGVWQPTPPDFSPAANAHVPLIPPFALPSSSLFRAPPPPTLTSAEYTDDYNYTKEVGARNSATRTAEQTNVALDWRLPLVNVQTWNRIAQEVAAAQGTTVTENARLFALLDIAINDGLETSFGTKFAYGLWRPVTAIRNGGLGGDNDTEGNPLADGNPDTVGDPDWLPLHPSTPPYPTYSGNAATIGAASATVLTSFFGSNDIPFQVHWAFSGETRSYAGFWSAAQEEADSRVFGGIHFRFDSVAGQGIGRQVGEYVFEHVLLPRSQPSSLTSTSPDPGGTADGALAEMSSVRIGLTPLAGSPVGSTAVLAAPAAAQPGETLPDAVLVAALASPQMAPPPAASASSPVSGPLAGMQDPAPPDSTSHGGAGLTFASPAARVLRTQLLDRVFGGEGISPFDPLSDDLALARLG